MRLESSFAVLPGITLLLFSMVSGCHMPTESEPAKFYLVDVKVQAGCGECLFGMGGNGCDLAIRYGGNCYYVHGEIAQAHIDSHGDAHAEDGLCNSIRWAVVSGEVVNGRLNATRFELLRDECSEVEQPSRAQK